MVANLTENSKDNGSCPIRGHCKKKLYLQKRKKFCLHKRDELNPIFASGSSPSIPDGTKVVFEMLQRREFCSTNPNGS